MGHTGNMIVNDAIRQMCVPLENSAYGSGHKGVAVLFPGFAINW